LLKSGYTGDDLTRRFATEIGKDQVWKSDVTYQGFTEFGINYIEELGMQAMDDENTLSFPGLKQGQVINNGRLCEIFKCSTQGGMRRSRTTNSLIIVSNHLKSVYEDRWIGDVFHYTGMGLKENQTLDFAQNRTVNESQTNGIQMYLFEVFKDKEYLYQGVIKLADKPYQEIQPDDAGNARNVWIFPLSLINKGTAFITQETFDAKTDTASKKARRSSTASLKERVKNAPSQPGIRNVLSKQYERNSDVAELAKRRANGLCELCNTNAPFIKKSGEPYLESHHIIWLSKEGEDNINNTVALCPNCHRRMHSLDIQKDRDKLIIKARAEIKGKEKTSENG
jgi:5-methylcytosine-specific restriction protein A